MKKSIKYLKRIGKLKNKIISLGLVICLSITTIGLNSIIPVFAVEEQELIINDCSVNGNVIEFYAGDGETLMGQITLKIGEETLIPAVNDAATGAKYSLPTFSSNYSIGVYIVNSTGYEANSYSVNGESYLTPGGNDIPYISISSVSDMMASFNFQSINNSPGPGDQPGDDGPMPSLENYPILAYFGGIAEPVLSNVDNNTITIPNGWTSGAITFKAKICTIDGIISPDYGEETACTGGEKSVTDLEVEATLRSEGTDENDVSGSPDDKSININPGFFEVGKVGIHFVTDILNTNVAIISEDLIQINAVSPMRMSYSYGRTLTDQAVVTNTNMGNISIFFGNTETTLFATGPKVVGITNLTGVSHVLNEEEKSVTVSLPPLNKEAETPVSIEIELENGTKVTKQINIIRTAIDLGYEGESKTINAGYVMHKSYLYNNQPHNDEIFDAYLQVILYRDDIVVGYKQVQIDDEEFINNLGIDEDGSIESAGPERIVLFSGEIEGVNKASVFLTNGPIDYKNNVLPSIEFGLGAGVEIEWEAI